MKKVQSAINNTTNRSTRNTPVKLLYGFKPRSMAVAALVSAIQETLNEVDLKEMREVAKGSIDEEQKKQNIKSVMWSWCGPIQHQQRETAGN